MPYGIYFKTGHEIEVTITMETWGHFEHPHSHVKRPDSIELIVRNSDYGCKHGVPTPVTYRRLFAMSFKLQILEHPSLPNQIAKKPILRALKFHFLRAIYFKTSPFNESGIKSLQQVGEKWKQYSTIIN